MRRAIARWPSGRAATAASRGGLYRLEAALILAAHTLSPGDRSIRRPGAWGFQWWRSPARRDRYYDPRADAIALFREYERRRAAALSCPHDALRLVVLDSAAGVGCGRCGGVLAACAEDGEHVPEDLWNRLAAVDSSCKPCTESRPDVCAFCGEPVAGAPPYSVGSSSQRDRK